MNAVKLEKFKKLLIEARAKILNNAMHSQAEALKLKHEDIIDETDHAAAIVQQGVALNVQEMNRYLLKEIGHALEKFEDGSYGICEDTEEPIEEARLEAQPWTRYCVEAAELREQKAKRYASGYGGGRAGSF
jgi:DnaK suppressor protein